VTLFFEGIGRYVISLLEHIGGCVRLFLEAAGFIARGQWRPGLTVMQMSFLGVNSLSIVLMTTTFAGMVIALQMAHVAVQYGVGKMVGGSASLAMTRELGPMLTAIVVAGRAGSAITAEIGSMKVTEQIDALKMLAVSPTGYLVVPRILAMLVMVPLLTLFSDISGLIGGSVVAFENAGIPYQVFWDSVRQMTLMSDLNLGLVKSVIFGAEVAVISCYQGLKTGRGAAGVGQATTSSVVVSMVAIFISNFILSSIMFKVN
jgi:phospholipid/cholesterol/gamma-HCH transport system permease protein